MNKLRNSLILSVTLLVVPCASGAADIADPYSGEKTFDVALERGKTQVIDIPANPTTGYDWEISGPYDNKTVSFAGMKSEQVNVRCPGITGAPSVEHWSFTAKSKGNTTIRLVYKRSWEKDHIAVRNYRFSVK